MQVSVPVLGPFQIRGGSRVGLGQSSSWPTQASLGSDSGHLQKRSGLEVALSTCARLRKAESTRCPELRCGDTPLQLSPHIPALKPSQIFSREIWVFQSRSLHNSTHCPGLPSKPSPPLTPSPAHLPCMFRAPGKRQESWGPMFYLTVAWERGNDG